jgi:hypothetical protein
MQPHFRFFKIEMAQKGLKGPKRPKKAQKGPKRPKKAQNGPKGPKRSVKAI